MVSSQVDHGQSSGSCQTPVIGSHRARTPSASTSPPCRGCSAERVSATKASRPAICSLGGGRLHAIRRLCRVLIKLSRAEPTGRTPLRGSDVRVPDPGMIIGPDHVVLAPATANKGHFGFLLNRFQLLKAPKSAFRDSGTNCPYPQGHRLYACWASWCRLRPRSGSSTRRPVARTGTGSAPARCSSAIKPA